MSFHYHLTSCLLEAGIMPWQQSLPLSLKLTDQAPLSQLRKYFSSALLIHCRAQNNYLKLVGLLSDTVTSLQIVNGSPHWKGRVNLCYQLVLCSAVILKWLENEL